ncbi:MAG: dicarboxylate/amino acid:cation symporter [Ignavibacteriales bacterium]|nr:dicarboxylate/amino acid:cation symporter [Ignavibacteriales bacterium]
MKSIFTWIWNIKLHNKILLALVLGAFFGAWLNVSKYELSIKHLQDGKEQSVTIKNWDSIELVDDLTQTIRGTFEREDQLRLLNYFQSLTKTDKSNLVVRVIKSWKTEDGTIQSGVETFRSIKSIEKVKTIPLYIKPIGTLFIRLLMFIAIPLVLASLIVGASSLGNIRTVGKIGAKMVLFYACLISIAITIGLTLANTIRPGDRLSSDAREKLLVEFTPNIQSKIQETVDVNVVNTIVNIVPTNAFAALANSEMLQVVFFALIVGVTLTMIKKEKSEPVIKFFDGFSDMMIRMVEMIMKLAPLGVFALISATVSEFGFDILQTLFWYAATLLIGLIFHQFFVLGTFVRVFAKMNPIKFFKGIRDVMLISFTASSSAAALPVNMECCEVNLGVPKKITSFVLPLGATINMDGTSMYQAVAAVFIAQVYGIELHLSEQLIILLTALLASIGTAPVPGVGLIMLIIVLRSVNVPEEGIALILGIDRFLDMCRTVVNTSGDAVVATIIAKQEGVLGKTNLATAT